MDRRLSRRNLALSIAALALALSGVAGCGFNYATDRSNTVSNGVSDQDGTVDVLNAAIVSGTEGSGTFIASLSNNSTTDTISLDSLESGSGSTVEVASFSPVEVKPRGLVNLADGQGVKVSGEFAAGEFVALSIGFDNGETADINVPVVRADDEYTGLDNGTGTPSPSAS